MIRSCYFFAALTLMVAVPGWLAAQGEKPAQPAIPPQAHWLEVYPASDRIHRTAR